MKNITTLRNTFIILAGLGMSLLLAQCYKMSSLDAKTIGRGAFVPGDTAARLTIASFYDQTARVIAKAANFKTNADTSFLGVAANKEDSAIIGVQTILKTKCGISNCHGNGISNGLSTFSYAEIKKIVTPGNPTASKLWQTIVSNDPNKAMPPIVNGVVNLTAEEKNTIYMWIATGANENVMITDYTRPAINIIITHCAGATCHSRNRDIYQWLADTILTGKVVVAGYGFAKRGGLIDVLYNALPTDTNNYKIVTNHVLLNNAWQVYYDSLAKFYTDTVANLAFRPWMNYGGKFNADGSFTKGAAALARESYATQEDIIFFANHPKLSPTTPAYPYRTYNLFSRIIANANHTYYYYNPRTTVATAPWVSQSRPMSDPAHGNMSYMQIAIVAGWYMNDSRIDPLFQKIAVGNPPMQIAGEQQP